MDMEFYFEMLNELRESGTMNMFGAPKWLQENFDLSKTEAREVFMAWTESFG
jgi:hypothetical protein